MRIAVDAMGGDHAPREIVAGTLEAARTLPGIERLFLVGQEEALRREMPVGAALPPTVEIVHASEVVGMDEAPAVAVRRKKDSSIGRAVDLVKAGRADAVFSAGNTGAVVAATALKLRTLEGVLRPAIATMMPTMNAPFILIDAGANTDCSPQMLLQFAVMGAVYAREIIRIPHPLIGLLSIGGEETKGNQITKETFDLLKASPLNFAGNVEGHDLFEGRTHVVVCDGFVGNVALKSCESVAHFIGGFLKQELTRNWIRKLGALLVKPGLDEIRRRSDPSMYGGAPLLGINGVCIVAHGASNARAVFNGIRVAGEAVGQSVNQCIIQAIKELCPA